MLVLMRSFPSRTGGIVAVSDVYGGLCNDNGLDCKAIKQVAAETGTIMISGCGGNPQEVLEVPVDILVPAAEQPVMVKQLTHRSESYCRGPAARQAEADRILKIKAQSSCPLLANTGGVTVSYFRWVQRVQSLSWVSQ